tara:strand:- start:618 stop:725 length:108 start_codon:yes stop_codon:yes gene_type:complete
METVSFKIPYKKIYFLRDEKEKYPDIYKNLVNISF